MCKLIRRILCALEDEIVYYQLVITVKYADRVGWVVEIFFLGVQHVIICCNIYDS